MFRFLPKLPTRPSQLSITSARSEGTLASHRPKSICLSLQTADGYVANGLVRVEALVFPSWTRKASALWLFKGQKRGNGCCNSDYGPLNSNDPFFTFSALYVRTRSAVVAGS